MTKSTLMKVILQLKRWATWPRRTSLKPTQVMSKVSLVSIYRIWYNFHVILLVANSLFTLIVDVHSACGHEDVAKMKMY